MRALLLGATGMAGSAIKKELLRRGVTVIGVARSGSDTSCDLADQTQVAELLRSYRFDALINAAAQVDINRCETDPLESWVLNAKLVSILGNFSFEFETPLLQISTDHFYNYGDRYAHRETDPVFCVNEYARHKYAAEFFALTSPNSLVLRTSILGLRNKGQHSLIDWAIESLLKRQEIELFSDAWTSSIAVQTFAKIALKLFLDLQYRGLLNVASSEVYSKEQLIRKLADILDLDHSNCLSGSVAKMNNRANCLGLDVTKAERLLDQKMPSMEEVCHCLVDDCNLNGDRDDA